MKVLIFGAHGYLGGEFQKLYPDAVCPSVDIADRSAVSEVLDRERPDTVINAAGKTGRPNVDWCEDHKLETIESNVLGPLVLLSECKKRDILFVHLGSGCIYQGGTEKEFTEEDPPNFAGSFYARSKGIADSVLREFPDDVLNVRLRMPFDGSGNPRSLISKLIKYERVLDAENSLTYIPDLLSAMKTMIGKRVTGTYNIVNPGTMSPYRIMEMYREIVDPSHIFERLKLSELPEVAKAGRSNCVLSTAKLEKHGIRMMPVEEAVREALESLSHI